MSSVEKKNSFKKFPYKITKAEGELHDRVVKYFKGQSGAVMIGPEKWFWSPKFADFAEELYNFEARPDDVWVCTMPRVGTTWTQEMVWLICNNLDYEGAKSAHTFDRFPFIEYHTLSNENALMTNGPEMEEKEYEKLKNRYNPVELLKAQKTQRLIKTHVAMMLLPHNIMDVGAKVVYVVRNPKDMAVSWYHFTKTNPVLGFTGNFEEFLEFFLNDHVVFSPYWKHVLDGWSKRHHKNVHFMFYEDLKLDLANSLKKLAVFLEKPLKDEDLPKLLDHLSFDSMKKNEAVNFRLNTEKALGDSTEEFLRKGQVGGNPEMTPELSKRFDEWTAKNLAGTDFKFPNY